MNIVVRVLPSCPAVTTSSVNQLNVHNPTLTKNLKQLHWKRVVATSTLCLWQCFWHEVIFVCIAYLLISFHKSFLQPLSAAPCQKI